MISMAFYLVGPLLGSFWQSWTSGNTTWTTVMASMPAFLTLQKPSTGSTIPRYWRNWTVLEFVTRKRLGSSLTCSIALSAPARWNAHNRSRNQYPLEFLKGPFSARCSLSYFCGIFRVLSLVAALFLPMTLKCLTCAMGRHPHHAATFQHISTVFRNGRSTGLRHSTLASRYGHGHQKSPKAPTDTLVHASCPIVIDPWELFRSQKQLDTLEWSYLILWLGHLMFVTSRSALATRPLSWSG